MNTIHKQIQNGLSALGQDIAVDGAVGTQTLERAKAFEAAQAELIKTNPKAYLDALRTKVMDRTLSLLQKEQLTKDEIKDLQHAFLTFNFKGTSSADGLAGYKTACGLFSFLAFFGFDANIIQNKNLKAIYEKFEKQSGTYTKSQIARTIYPKGMAVENLPKQRSYTYIDEDQNKREIVFNRPINEGDLSSYYGSRMHPIFKRQKHHDGVDFGARMYAPVYAAADGEVIEVRRSNKGYGNHVKIRHGDGQIETLYGHLNAFANKLQEGRIVSAGDLIGFVGESGDADGPHLHYEVRIDGKQIDPLTLPEYYAFDLPEIVVSAPSLVPEIAPVPVESLKVSQPFLDPYPSLYDIQPKVDLYGLTKTTGI